MGKLPDGSRCRNFRVHAEAEFCSACGEADRPYFDGRDEVAEAEDKKEEDGPFSQEVQLGTENRPALTASSPVRHLRTRLTELRGSVWGTKEQLFERLTHLEIKRKSEERLRLQLEARAEEIRQGRVPTEKVTLPVPREPTPEEREKHELTHTPSEEWCPDCAMGMGVASPHKSKGVIEVPRRDPLVQLDFCFLKSDDEKDAEGKPWSTTLTGVDSDSGTPLAIAVPTKSPNLGYTVKVVVEYIRRLCHGRMRLRTDGEASIRQLAEKVKTLRKKLYDEDTVLEKTPRYSSQSLGTMICWGAALGVAAKDWLYRTRSSRK